MSSPISTCFLIHVSSLTSHLFYLPVSQIDPPRRIPSGPGGSIGIDGEMPQPVVGRVITPLTPGNGPSCEMLENITMMWNNEFNDIFVCYLLFLFWGSASIVDGCKSFCFICSSNMSGDSNKETWKSTLQESILRKMMKEMWTFSS